MKVHSSLPNCEIISTLYAGHASELAQKYSGKCELVIAVGGDGTLHEVMNGLLKIEDPNSRPALAVLRAGTGNDFARNLSYSCSPEKLVNAIKKSSFQNIDLGQVVDSSGNSSFFINSIDWGFGFATVTRIRDSHFLIPRPLVFPLAIASTFLNYKAAEIECFADDFHYKGKCLTAVIANGPWFGGGIGIAPEALLDDGFLNLTLVGNVSMLDFLRYLPSLKKGKKIVHPEVHYLKAKEFRLIGQGGIEADGELPELRLPLQIRVIPSGIRLLR